MSMKRILAVLLFLTVLNFVFPQSGESQEEQNLKEFEEFKRMREKQKKTEAEKKAKDREDDHNSGLFLSFGGATGNILSSGFERKKMEQTGFSTYGADFGIEFHLSPSAQFDPYLLGSVGGGLCGSSCSSCRGAAGINEIIKLTIIYYYIKIIQIFQIFSAGQD